MRHPTLRSEVPAGTPDESVPVFPRVRGGHVQLDYLVAPSEVITDIVRAAVRLAGLPDASEYSSHSLRASFVTLSARAGVSEARIAAVTGHKNLVVLRGYDRSSAHAHAQSDYLATARPAKPQVGRLPGVLAQLLEWDSGEAPPVAVTFPRAP